MVISAITCHPNNYWIPHYFFSCSPSLLFAKKRAHRHLSFLMFSSGPGEFLWVVNSHVKYLFIWLFEWQRGIKGGSGSGIPFRWIMRTFRLFTVVGSINGKINSSFLSVWESSQRWFFLWEISGWKHTRLEWEFDMTMGRFCRTNQLSHVNSE